MKKSNTKIESELLCKASASLSEAVSEELKEEDKSLKELLDEEERCIQGECRGHCRKQ